MHAGGDGEHAGPGAVASRHRRGAGATPRPEGPPGGTPDHAQTQPRCGKCPVTHSLRRTSFLREFVFKFLAPCVHVFVLFVRRFLLHV